MTDNIRKYHLRPLTLQGREVALHLRSEPMERVGNLQDFEGRGFCGYSEDMGREMITTLLKETIFLNSPQEI